MICCLPAIFADKLNASQQLSTGSLHAEHQFLLHQNISWTSRSTEAGLHSDGFILKSAGFVQPRLTPLDLHVHCVMHQHGLWYFATACIPSEPVLLHAVSHGAVSAWQRCPLQNTVVCLSFVPLNLAHVTSKKKCYESIGTKLAADSALTRVCNYMHQAASRLLLTSLYSIAARLPIGQ